MTAPHAPNHTAPLRRPRATVPTRVLARYLVPILTVHLLALLVFVPALFSWTGLVLCVVGVHFFGQAITIGYHRLLAHRSFKTPLWFEHALVVSALCSLEDSPARWVATHRMHHAHSDEDEDPHTPLVAFFWGHMGWLFLRNQSLHHHSNYERFARDVLRDPFYMWIEKNAWSPLWFYIAQVAVYAAAAFGAALLWTDAAGAAWFAGSVVVWGVYLRTVLVWHITWSVNSLTHLFGYRNHETEENSRNNWLVALFAAGEGWHNNHHADPACATVQHRWWELDVTYLQIRAFGLLGLAWEITPRREVRAEAAAKAAAAATEAKRARGARSMPGGSGDVVARTPVAQASASSSTT